MKGFPDLPPLWWLGSMAVIYLFRYLVPGWHIQAELMTGLAWILQALALGIIGWAGLWFFRKKTPIEPHHTPKVLIVEGPYRLSRNPVYLALVLFTLASAIGHGSVFGVIAAAVLWWVLDRRFAVPEEQGLKDVFGEAADTYLQQTKRWI